MVAGPRVSGLRIGIDARAAVEEGAGRGRVVRELLSALAERDDPHEYQLYTRTPWDGVDDERFSWRRIGSRDPCWNLRAALAANRECDVFLSSNSYLTTWFLRIPGVPIVYDLVTFDRSMRPSWRFALIERLTIGPAVRRCPVLVAISENTRDELAARYPSAAERTVVAPLAVSRELAAADGDPLPADLPAEFVLAVGTLEPRKNLPRLVAAYRALPAAVGERYALVVTGRMGWQTGETMEALRSLGPRCRMLGFVSDAALGELYRRCTVFCYPSLGEGFGLPVLEAMAAGAAVVTSDRSSLPEVGGDAVEYADPTDVTSIAAALERVLSDRARREELGRRARERAAAFSWARTADVVVGALELAAGARTSTTS